MEQNQTTNPFNMAPIADPYANESSTPMTSSPKVKPPEDIVANKTEKIRLEEETNRLFLKMGLDSNSANKELVAREKQKLAEQYEQDIKKIQEEGQEEAIKAGLEEAGEQLYAMSGIPMAQAVGIGLTSTMASMIDAGTELVNATMAGTTDKKAVKNGALPLINYKDRMDQFGLSETQKFVANITQNLAPAIGAATPGGFAVKTAATAVAAYAMLDPEQKTLGNMAEGTAFEKTPIVAPILQAIKKEDDDTFITGRVKNVAEWIIPDLAAAAVFTAAVRTYSATKRSFDTIQKIQKEYAIASDIPKSAQTTRAANVEQVNLATRELEEAVKLEQAAPAKVAEVAEEVKEPQQLELGIPDEAASKKQYSVTVQDVDVLSSYGGSSPEGTEIINKIRNIPEEEFLSKDGRRFSVSFFTERADDVDAQGAIVPVIRVTDRQTQNVIAYMPMIPEFATGADTIAIQRLGYVMPYMEEAYKGQGIMENAYKYARKHVENFSPSVSQTRAGAGFTNRIAMKSAIEQPDSFVQQQLRKNLDKQREQIRNAQVREKVPKQLEMADDIPKVPARTEQELLDAWNEDVRAFNTVDGIEASIKELDSQIEAAKTPQLSFPGLEVAKQADEIVDPIAEIGTKEFDAQVTQLAKELRDELAPVNQGVLRDGSRPLDEMFNKYTGRLELDVPASEQYDAFVARFKDALSKTPESTIEHNGVTYTIKVNKDTIYAIPSNKEIKSEVDLFNLPSVQLGAELNFEESIRPTNKSFMPAWYLVPKLIRQGRRGDPKTAGLVVKMLRFIRDNVGEIQSSTVLLAAGKNFINKLPKRLDDLTARDYESYARELLTTKKQEIIEARGKQIAKGADEVSIKDAQLDMLIAKRDGLEARRRELITAEQIAAQEDFIKDPTASGWERVAGIDTPPVYVNEAKEVAVNSNNATLIEAIATAYDNNPSAFTPRGPQTTPEMLAKAKAMVADPNQVQALLEVSAQRPLTAEERIALDLVREKVADDVLKKVGAAVQSKSELDLIAAKEAVDAMLKLSNKAQGTNSEAGRSLGIIRNLALLAKTGDEQAIKTIGQVGRNKLRTEYIAKYGKEDLEALITQFDEISRIDDTAFVVKGDEVVRRTKYMRLNDALYSMYVNALLTPKTVVSVLASNTFMGVGKVMDNFYAAKIGAALETKDAYDMVYAKTFMQQLSNNYRDSLQAAYNAALDGQSKYVRFDMTSGSKNADAVVANSLWEMVAEKGVSFVERAAYSKTLTAPTRMVMGADTFVAHKIMNADLVARATSLGVKKGLEKSELEDFIMAFVRNPDEATLAEVTDNAQRISMQRDLSKSWLALGQKAVEKDPTGYLRFLYPFANTKINLMTTALEYGPASILLDNTRAAIRGGGKARDMALARMATGMTFTTAVSGLVAAGVLVLPKEDYKQETALDAEGKGKIGASLIIGGKAYPVSWVDPLGRAMNLIAAAYPSIAASDSQMDREISAVALATVVGYLDDSAYDMFGELNSVLKAAKGKEELSPRISKMLSGTVRIPLEGTIKSVSTTWSPEKGSPITEDDEIVTYFFNRLKNVAGYNLPPQRNILGYSVEEPNGIGAFGPFYASDIKVSPVYENLRKFADYDEKLRRGGYKPLLSIEMPDKEISVSPSPGVAGIKVRLTAQEYDDLIVEATSSVQLRGGQMRTLEGALQYFFNVEGAKIAKDIDKRIAGTVDQEERRQLQETMHLAYSNNIKSIINSYYKLAQEKIAAKPNVQARAYEQHKKRLRFKDSPLSNMLTIGE